MTAVTLSELEVYFNDGVKQNKAVMVIWTDCFDYEDYPEYFDDKEAARKEKEDTAKNEKQMRRFQEAYDLKLPFKEQPGMTNGRGRANCL